MAAGAQYRYQLGSGLAVPDPASRAQVEDVMAQAWWSTRVAIAGATRLEGTAMARNGAL